MKFSKFPEETPLAMSYVPFQEYEETYPENMALQMATLFPELYYPFEGGEVYYNG